MRWLGRSKNPKKEADRTARLWQTPQMRSYLRRSSSLRACSGQTLRIPLCRAGLEPNDAGSSGHDVTLYQCVQEILVHREELQEIQKLNAAQGCELFESWHCHHVLRRVLRAIGELGLEQEMNMRSYFSSVTGLRHAMCNMHARLEKRTCQTFLYLGFDTCTAHNPNRLSSTMCVGQKLRPWHTWHAHVRVCVSNLPPKLKQK